MKKHLVAVYGSLLSGLGNHSVIESKNTELLGEFETDPVYSMYDLGYYPGLKEDGKTSVKLEVYAVDDITAGRVDRLEGYTEGVKATFYDKKVINTPFGEAGIYTYVPLVNKDRLVESGDWRSHLNKKING